MLGVAAAVALTLGPAQAAAPPPPGPTPDQQAATLAGTTFAFGCLQRLGAATSAADFAHGSDALGVQLARDVPSATAAVKVDGDDGRGCRVRYTGPFADRMWTADLAVLAGTPASGQGGCTVAEQADTRVRAICVDTASTPPHRADLLIERSGAGSSGTVSISLAWRDPGS